MVVKLQYDNLYVLHVCIYTEVDVVLVFQGFGAKLL